MYWWMISNKSASVSYDSTVQSHDISYNNFKSLAKTVYKEDPV